MEGQLILALIIGVAATVEDLWHREISNWTSMMAVVSGLGFHFYERGGQGIASAFWSSLAGFGVFLAFYLLGGMGGGDVKLMAGFGAVLGKASVLLEAAIWTAAIGGVMAIVVLGWRALMKLRTQQVAKDLDPEAVQKRASIPYAPAITFGVWLALLANL